MQFDYIRDMVPVVDLCGQDGKCFRCAAALPACKTNLLLLAYVVRMCLCVWDGNVFAKGLIKESQQSTDTRISNLNDSIFHRQSIENKVVSFFGSTHAHTYTHVSFHGRHYCPWSTRYILHILCIDCQCV